MSAVSGMGICCSSQVHSPCWISPGRGQEWPASRSRYSLNFNTLTPTYKVSQPWTFLLFLSLTNWVEATSLCAPNIAPVTRSRAEGQRAWSLCDIRPTPVLSLFLIGQILKGVTGLTVVAWAEGGLQGEAGGSTTQPLSTSRRHRGSVKFATGHVHFSCIEGHHFIVKRQQRRIGRSWFCKCCLLEMDDNKGPNVYDGQPR